MKQILNNLVFCMVLVLPGASWAAHPLITDDSGTQGKGKFQIEVTGEYDYDKETIEGVTTKQTNEQAAASLSYGVVDSTDVVLSLPYVWGTVTENGTKVYDEEGISDSTLEVKWRFFDKDGLSFAVKPGVVFPTGDKNKGLGSGEVGYHLFLIGSREAAPWAFHANVGFIRNENGFDEEKNLWHASLAATYDALERLKLAGNIGAEKNPVKGADNDPAFALAGVIYSLNDQIDVDFGVKSALTSSETDLSLMAGTTIRF